MLKKLTKHEFRATARIMWPIFGGMAALALLTRFGAIPLINRSENFFLSTISVIMVMVFFFGMAALAFAPLVISGTRFKHSILGSEGYLTMTLPASTHQLLGSKLITNAVWYAASAVVTVLIFLLLVGDLQTIAGIPEFIAELFRAFRHLKAEEIGHVVLIGLEILLNIVAGVTLCTVVVYAAYAIGYSANKHKSLWTVLLIYGFYHLCTWAGIATLIFFGNEINRRSNLDMVVQDIEGFLGIAFCVMLVMIAAFYFTTHYFLTHKLNLE